MTLYDEINLLMEKLTAAWGNVHILCDGTCCHVSDGHSHIYKGETLIEALRLAENGIEEEAR